MTAMNLPGKSRGFRNCLGHLNISSKPMLQMTVNKLEIVFIFCCNRIPCETFLVLDIFCCKGASMGKLL